MEDVRDEPGEPARPVRDAGGHRIPELRLHVAAASPCAEIGERAVSRKSRPWEITPDDFFEDVEEVRALFARLVGGDAEGVAIVPSVSYGIAVAAANVSVREGERIMILEDQFPSNVYSWRELASREGARLVTVPRPDDPTGREP